MPGPLMLRSTLKGYKYGLGFLNPFKVYPKNRPWEYTRFRKIDNWIHRYVHGGDV